MGTSHDRPGAAGVTQLLNEVSAGDAESAAELLPLVYEQLRALAEIKMRQERPSHTLQPTALVHEAYLRLVDEQGLRRWEGRRHFFRAAAEAMRRILVDRARHKGSAKSGGGRQRISLGEMELLIHEPSDDLLALNEALVELTSKHPEKAELVKLRYFAGLTLHEAAQTLDISAATAERRWAFARAWLYKRINAG